MLRFSYQRPDFNHAVFFGFRKLDGIGQEIEKDLAGHRGVAMGITISTLKIKLE
jgi:hypothetical protein